MIKVSEAVFHPDASAVSVEEFSKRVAEMRESLRQIQQSSDSTCESTSDNFQTKMDWKESEKII